MMHSNIFKKSVIFFSVIVIFLSAVWAGNSIGRLAKELVSGKTPLKGKKVAILAFPYHDGKISSGSSIIPERLTTHMVGMAGVQVMERRLLKKILEEKKLNETGVIDASMARQIGTILGVNALITGTLIDLDKNKTEINARVLDSESGEIMSAAQEFVERTWADAPRTIAVRVTPSKPSDVDGPSAEEDSDPAPVVIPKKVMKLSNESFPPGRRAYHKGAGEEEKRPKKKNNNYDKQEDESAGDAYEEGYRDAERDNLHKTPEKEKKPTGFSRDPYEKKLGVQSHYEYTTYERPPSGGSVKK